MSEYAEVELFRVWFEHNAEAIRTKIFSPTFRDVNHARFLLWPDQGLKCS